MTNQTSRKQEIEQRIAELEKDNAEAPCWGAAVGARAEEIRSLYDELERITP